MKILYFTGTGNSLAAAKRIGKTCARVCPTGNIRVKGEHADQSISLPLAAL